MIHKSNSNPDLSLLTSSLSTISRPNETMANSETVFSLSAIVFRLLPDSYFEMVI
jgi:hypothetical protein